MILTPVHDDVPHTAVHRVNDRDSDEESKKFRRSVYAIQAQCHIGKDRESVLAAVHQVWENVPSIIITKKRSVDDSCANVSKTGKTHRLKHCNARHMPGKVLKNPRSRLCEELH